MKEAETHSVILRKLNQVIETLTTLSPNNVPKLLTVQEAAAALGVSRDSVRRMCDRRQLAYVQSEPNSAKRIPLDELNKWIESNCIRPIS